MKILENICVAISSTIIIITIVGVLLERFQYIYDGFFNNDGIIFVIIGIAIMAIPYIVFYLQIAIDNLRRKSK